MLALKGAREQMKPEALYEIDAANGLTASAFMAASSVRSSFYAALCKLFETYDAIALPSAQVWPFDVNLRYPTEIVTAKGTVQMDTYHRWMESSIYATFAGLPAISVPAGFGANGLPMGLQIIGKPQGDAELLRIAALFDRNI
jgi:amidase